MLYAREARQEIKDREDGQLFEADCRVEEKEKKREKKRKREED